MPKLFKYILALAHVQNFIILKAKTGTTTTLTLQGPTTLEEGREFAAQLNELIARYNTLWFINPDGTKKDLKITATTGPIS